MSNSKFATADGAFQYDPLANYENGTFQNLSVKKCQSIASLLQIRNIKKYKKEELIPLMVQKHMERLNMRVVETEDFEGIEETKGNYDSSIVLSFTEQLKNNFNEIPYYIYNKEAWFKGNDVARYLEYNDPSQAIRDHVNDEDKLRFNVLNVNFSFTVFSIHHKGKIHPDTFFINKFGILVLSSKSRMPLARQFQKWLLNDVLPRIQLQNEKKIFEAEKKKFQEEKENFELYLQNKAISVIERNRMRNLLPVEEIYIATSSEYNQSYLYKIGKSNNTAKRLKSLNTSRLKNDEMYICHVSKCHDANTTETAIHNVLSRYRYEKNREFFQLDFETLKQIVEWGCQCKETFYDNCIGLFQQIRYNNYPDINPKQTPPVQYNN